MSSPIPPAKTLPSPQAKRDFWKIVISVLKLFLLKSDPDAPKPGLSVEKADPRQPPDVKEVPASLLAAGARVELVAPAVVVPAHAPDTKVTVVPARYSRLTSIFKGLQAFLIAVYSLVAGSALHAAIDAALEVLVLPASIEHITAAVPDKGWATLIILGITIWRNSRKHRRGAAE